jgi:NAD(P)-dependent dehydrogenase (short-subunit alcohol dehydrogenase family)
VINIGSVGGFATAPGVGLYGATKFAVEGITEALHGELAPLDVHVTVVEPGGFRTDFLDASSLYTEPHMIDDYAPTAGATRKALADVNHRQSGDPAKAAAAVVGLAESPEPPLRLVLGPDAVARVEAKLDLVARELDRHRALALSTDLPPSNHPA